MRIGFRMSLFKKILCGLIFAFSAGPLVAGLGDNPFENAGPEMPPKEVIPIPAMRNQEGEITLLLPNYYIWDRSGPVVRFAQDGLHIRYADNAFDALRFAFNYVGDGSRVPVPIRADEDAFFCANGVPICFMDRAPNLLGGPFCANTVLLAFSLRPNLLPEELALIFRMFDPVTIDQLQERVNVCLDKMEALQPDGQGHVDQCSAMGVWNPFAHQTDEAIQVKKGHYHGPCQLGVALSNVIPEDHMPGAEEISWDEQIQITRAFVPQVLDALQACIARIVDLPPVSVGVLRPTLSQLFQPSIEHNLFNAVAATMPVCDMESLYLGPDACDDKPAVCALDSGYKGISVAQMIAWADPEAIGDCWKDFSAKMTKILLTGTPHRALAALSLWNAFQENLWRHGGARTFSLEDVWGTHSGCLKGMRTFFYSPTSNMIYLEKKNTWPLPRGVFSCGLPHQQMPPEKPMPDSQKTFAVARPSPNGYDLWSVYGVKEIDESHMEGTGINPTEFMPVHAGDFLNMLEDLQVDVHNAFKAFSGMRERGDIIPATRAGQSCIWPKW